MAMRFNALKVPRSWYDAIQSLIDHGYHRQEDLTSPRYWERRITAVPAHQVVQWAADFRLHLPKVDELLQLDGVDSDHWRYYSSLAMAHDDIAYHLAEFADAYMEQVNAR